MDENLRAIGRISQEGTPQYNRGTNYFLGIGIDAYNAPLSKLRNCVRDVTVVRNVLVEQYDFEEENVFVLPEKEATRKGIIKAVQETLKKITDNDSLVFMFSGHGDNLDDSNIGFMIPIDAADDGDYINLSDIKSRLDAAKAKHILVIFDACFSGLLLTQRDARGQNLPENYPSRYAMTSGRNSPVDDGTGEHSPFAKALIDELIFNDESIGAVMLAQKILDRFRETGRDEEQLPDFGRINADIEFQGQYYFYPKNFENSLAREKTKRLEAEEARDMAKQALITAELERQNAEKQKEIALEMKTQAEAQKQIAVEMKTKAEENHQKSEKNARRALYFTIASLIGLVFAIWQYRTADTARLFSEKQERAAQNTAAFMQTKETDPTLAMRMMQYNMYRHPQSDISHALFYRTISDDQTDLVSKILRGHLLNFETAAFSFDGKYVAASGLDSTVKILSLETGKVEKILTGFISHVRAIAFSRDGKYVATGSDDNTVTVWSIETGNAETTFVWHQKAVWSVVFSPDGQYLATGSKDETVKIWSLKIEATASKAYTFPMPQDSTYVKGVGNDGAYYIYRIDVFNKQGTISFSPDGKYLVGVSTDGAILLWSVATKQIEKKIVSTRKYTNFSSVAFSPDSKYIATGDEDKTVKIWSVESGKEEKSFIGHQDIVSSVVFSPDGKFIATGSWDKTVKIWSVETGTLKKTLLNHQGKICSMAFSPDGKNLATASADKTVKTWAIELGEKRVNKENIWGYLGQITFSPNSQEVTYTVLAGSFSYYGVPILSLKNNETERGYNYKERVSAIAYSPNGQYMATASRYDSLAIIWSVETKQIVKSFEIGESFFNSVAFSPDGKYLATYSHDSSAKMWSVETGNLTQTFTTDAQNKIWGLRFSPDGKYLATYSGDSTAKIWSVGTGKVEKTLSDHKNSVGKVIFSPDGRFLFTQNDSIANMWSVKTGKIERTFTDVGSIAFSTDGKYMATGGKEALIWSTKTGKVEKKLIGHQGRIKAIVFSQNGQFIATTSMDNTAKVWSSQSGRAEKTFRIATKSGRQLAFSPDGQYIAVDGNGEPRAFDIHQSIEDNTFPYPLYEMADAGLVIEPADTPQYISELLDNVKEGKLGKKEAFDKAERGIKDASVLKKLRQDLKLDSQ